MVGSARAAVLAIDLGSEFLKISIVKPGRTPISIVLNEMSKRKTSAQVAYVNGDRLLGEEAAAVAARVPDLALGQLRDFLGVQAASPGVQSLLAEQHLPWKVVPVKGRGTVAFQLGKGDPVTIEEAVASLLAYAQKLGVAAADGAGVPDAVIAVPAWFGQAQRRAVLDAAGLAGLNVLSLINGHAAVALQFGIERSFVNKTEHVIFYDMGYSSTEVALVKYSSFDVKEGSRVNTYGQFEVVDVAWAAGLGSGTLDGALMRHFAAEFDEKHLGGEGHVLDHPKAVGKLKKQVKRVKQVLSANSESSLSVEELHNGMDFQSHITREAFEELAGDFFASAAAPLKALLTRNPVDAQNVSAVELLGGGTRVPRLQQVLSEALGGRGLDKHLDADEAIVLGAGLFAANLSTTFRLRKFGMSDGAAYPLAYRLEETKGAAQNDEGTTYDPKQLAGFLKRLPVRRVVHLPNVSADPINLQLLEGPPKPGATPSEATQSLGAFTITGIDDVIKKHGEAGKISTHLTVDSSGIVSLDRAEAVLERMELVNVTVTVPANATEGGNTTTGKETKASTDAKTKGSKTADTSATASENATKGDNATAAGNVTAAATVTKVVQKERKKIIRVPLTVGGPGLAFPGLSPADRKNLADRMAALAAADAAKREAAGAKNALESYILSTRAAVNDDEAIALVTTEKERTQFVAALDAAEEWLYEGGEDAPAKEHRGRLSELKKAGDPIHFRRAEVPRRAALEAKADKFAELAATALAAWPKDKPWLNETDTVAFSKQVEEFRKWFADHRAAQAKKAPHQEPAWTSAAVSDRLNAVRKSFAKLKNTPKPKPPPPPPSNDTAGSNATTAGDKKGNGKADKKGEKGDKKGAKADKKATKADEAAADKAAQDTGKGGKTKGDQGQDEGTAGGDGGAGAAAGKSDDAGSRSWDDILKGMKPEDRKKMEDLMRPGPGGGGARMFGGGGKDDLNFKTLNLDDLMKGADIGKQAPRAGRSQTGGEGGEFADGLDDHDEL